MTGAGRGAAWQLHPSVLHHLVNTMGWSGLHPTQQAAVAPLLAGEDVIMVAPTAGGKTEAAMLPLLSRMAEQGWTGTSILYLCPLKALLNSLLPRLERYADWLGRRAAIWHGDTTAGNRRKALREQPDILLTTPESLEAMLVSANVDHAMFFRDVRAVVVDEVHAFAGDDRGWHLLAVLERLSHLIDRPVQRVGLSATVGNPDALLAWLQGSGRGQRPARVVASPTMNAQRAADIELDYVGSVENAAKVITALHRGEKRLVFCESRKRVEELGTALRSNGVTTFLSHASLSIDERRRAEAAFADARDCVIVSTSTLELGIDVGDLDRVIQIDAPRTVASFLQRIGRTGRRPDSLRNCLFLATDRQSLVQAAALLVLWGRGWVEPVLPPPEPRHIVAQQILALCLQQHRVGERLWPQWWNGLEPFTHQTSAVIARHLIDQGYLERDGDTVFIGPEAELRFGRRHFMGLTAVFTTAPEFTVLAGRTELGRVDPAVLVEEVQGPRRLLLGGRSWQVTYIDWTRRRCFVEPADGGGRARWTGLGIAGLSFELSRAMRDVLIGANPPVKLTHRATARLAGIRDQDAGLARADGTVIIRAGSGDVRWWTWAGYRANATLASTLSGLTDPMQNHEDNYIRLRKDLLPAEWRASSAGAAARICLPQVDEKALAGLKFSKALPDRLATATLAARLADVGGAAAVLAEPTWFAIG